MSAVIFSLLASMLSAHSLEPRLYSNAPVGMNFLLVGYGRTSGNLDDNPEAGLEDAELNVDKAVFAYARVIEMFGQSGKIDLIIPSACINGDAIYQGEHISRDVCGMGDIKTRLSLNVYGSPALSLKEFAGYKQDIIVGLSLQVTAPTGQYEKSKLVNVGNNRWAIKPGIGISKGIEKVILEIDADVEFYSDNDDFMGNIKREQDPLYSTQGHLIYTFSSGYWLGLDLNYYWGGETTKNGVKSDDELSNSRWGATLAVPINKKNSLKFYGHSGISTRTGTDFDMLGVIWQYRWGAGL